MSDLKQVEPTYKRIKKALSIRGLKQVDLIERTGIPKGSISQYARGYVEPKQDRLYLMAKALNVNPVWLMGLDVPMEVKAEPTIENADALADLMHDARLLEQVKKIIAFDDKKKETLYSYIDFLSSN